MGGTLLFMVLFLSISSLPHTDHASSTIVFLFSLSLSPYTLQISFWEYPAMDIWAEEEEEEEEGVEWENGKRWKQL